MNNKFYQLYSKKHSPGSKPSSPGEVTISRHENASIYAYENVVSLSLDEVSSHLEKTISHIQNLIEKKGGLIGHIKAYAEESSRYADFSSTGGDITVHHGEISQVRIYFTAIVFLMEACSIRAEMQGEFDQWI